MKVGQRVKCVKRAADDIAASWIGRYGTIIKRGRKEDGVQTYVIQISGRSSPLILWEDEIVAVEKRGNKERS